MFNTIENTLANNPFYIRRLIVQSSLLISFMLLILITILIGSPVNLVALYLIIATALDQYLFYVEKMKSSNYAEADRLLVENEATLVQLDQYSANRRNIRLVSFFVGVLAGATSLILLPDWFMEVFCLGYITATITGIAFSKIDIKNKYPPAFVRNDKFYTPGQPMVGGVSVSMFVAGQSSGITYGPIDPNR